MKSNLFFSYHNDGRSNKHQVIFVWNIEIVRFVRRECKVCGGWGVKGGGGVVVTGQLEDFSAKFGRDSWSNQ